jgi:hypothetical protein
MNPLQTAIVVLACLVAAVLLGRGIRRLLPEHHLSAETKDTVKAAIGLIATMAALLLGLLVSSAKNSYDQDRGQVIQLAAKIHFLDRLLAIYGSETADARAKLRSTVEDAIHHIWPEESNQKASLAPNVRAGDALYGAIQSLSPHGDAQTSLKSQATSLVLELGQLRSLLVAEAVASISEVLLIVVVCWLVVVLLSFSILAPPNATANVALLISAVAVSGAILLILELDQPFGGLIQISSQPILNTLSQLPK